MAKDYGAKNIRRQADERVQSYYRAQQSSILMSGTKGRFHPGIDVMEELRSEREQMLLDTVAMLKADNEQLERKLTRSEAVRVGRRAQVRQINRRTAIYKEQAQKWIAAFLDKKKAHDKLSLIIRSFVSPDRYHEWRKSVAADYPALFIDEIGINAVIKNEKED